ncbi:2',3'-cyclic-nucleotide 3'-phosphodiesterase [Paraphoma chrysanthemicola]|uniref:2',3'-cyclic-nucleotide 3'-phosphodiesterase n=1 Tax=Paraphoma chrysanthemicola TaxID=798071 RepID=A0A8K0W596_9PLEO|nr:2',3'-cyclic-nucleotide 3'-phosphodiesterase [Paraphoma chrysanthemicola]
MPGSSLWLLPPKSHPLDKILPKLVEQTSSHFGSSHSFLPHVTLTSEVSPSTYSAGPQAWLDSLTLPSSDDVQVEFEKLASEDVFFRKLYIKCRKTNGVKKLAQVCREKVAGYEEDGKAETWAEEAYNPHLSLLYHDCPKVEPSDLAPIERLAQESGISFASKGKVRGWTGGRVVLVPTDKPIHQWLPIAERALQL